MEKHEHKKSEIDESVKAIPIDELLKDAAPPEESGLITMLGVPADKLAVLVENRIDKVSPIQFVQSSKNDSGSYDNLLWFAALNTGSEIARSEEALANLTKEERASFTYRVEKDGRVLLGPGVVEAAANLAANVSGREGAIAMLNARKGRFRRFPLYNSGIAVDLRTPSVAELGDLIRRCRLDLNEYGRQWGAPFYMYYGYILTQAFVDFVMKLTVSASIKNYMKPGVLISQMKFPDLNVLYIYIASLMYPKGYENFRHFCTRPFSPDYPNGCDHVSSETVDVLKMAKTKFSRFTAESVEHMAKARSVEARFTLPEVEAYRAQFNLTKVIDHEGFRFFLHVPSVAEYLDCGERFNADLTREVNVGDADEITRTIGFRELRLYLPWIKRIEAFDDEGTVVTATEDKITMETIVDQLMDDPSYIKGLREPIVAFINDSQLTHIGYPTFSCPQCGYQPEIPSGFFTVDAVATFFTMLLKKLTKLSDAT